VAGQTKAYNRSMCPNETARVVSEIRPGICHAAAKCGCPNSGRQWVSSAVVAVESWARPADAV